MSDIAAVGFAAVGFLIPKQLGSGFNKTSQQLLLSIKTNPYN
jgi:hypothetical protein